MLLICVVMTPSGPCTSMKSTPWWQQAARNQLESPDDWRLLTAHESGKILLWDPGMKQMQPLLEIEFRRSPIRWKSYTKPSNLIFLSAADRESIPKGWEEREAYFCHIL